MEKSNERRDFEVLRTLVKHYDGPVVPALAHERLVAVVQELDVVQRLFGRRLREGLVGQVLELGLDRPVVRVDRRVNAGLDGFFELRELCLRDAAGGEGCKQEGGDGEDRLHGTQTIGAARKAVK